MSIRLLRSLTVKGKKLIADFVAGSRWGRGSCLKAVQKDFAERKEAKKTEKGVHGGIGGVSSWRKQCPSQRVSSSPDTGEKFMLDIKLCVRSHSVVSDSVQPYGW